MVARLVSDCAHRVTLIHLNDPSKLAGLFLLEWHPYWSHCGRRARPFGGRALREQGNSMGAIPVPSSCAFYEQRGLLAAPSSSFGGRALREQRRLTGHPSPLHRAGCEDGWLVDDRTRES